MKWTSENTSFINISRKRFFIYLFFHSVLHILGFNKISLIFPSNIFKMSQDITHDFLGNVLDMDYYKMLKSLQIAALLQNILLTFYFITFCPVIT